MAAGRQNFRQQVKHAKLYADLLIRLETGGLRQLWTLHRRGLLSFYFCFHLRLLTVKKKKKREEKEKKKKRKNRKIKKKKKRKKGKIKKKKKKFLGILVSIVTLFGNWALL